MQFFSDDYLMHYGIKGMKWKKRKGNEEFKTPDEYLADAYSSVRRSNEASTLRGGTKYAKEVKDWHREVLKHPGAQNAYKEHKLINIRANEARRADLKKAREAAYKKNQKRIAKQQRKAKVKNALKRVKNKVFVDTSNSTKVGKHLYVEHH